MSTIRTDTLSNAAGSKSVPVNTVVDGSAKAWVNFNGTGTVAIRAAFNVSSITDNGTGDYTVNFTTAMTDANYSTNCLTGDSSGYAACALFATAAPQTTSSVRIASVGFNSALFDRTFVNVAIFR